MKKAISIVLTMIMLMFSVNIIASAELVTDQSTGISNVKFENGYIGFCIDSKLHGAANGDDFTPAESTSSATDNINNQDISMKLKILFTQCFNIIFTEDVNGGYYIEKNMADISLQNAIYHFSDNFWPSGLSKTITDTVKAYEGPDIPDDGYQIQTDDGKTITFHFMVLEPDNNEQQTFFAYKLEVTEDTPHTHNPSENWSSDEKNHWHECDCGEKSDLDEHEASIPDCSNASVCTVCQKELGGVDPENHIGETELRDAKEATEFEDGYTGDTYCLSCDEMIEEGEIIPATHIHDSSEDWSSDEKNHWHECNCGEKSDIGNHTYGDDGICTVCGLPSEDENEGEKDESTEEDNTTDLDSILEGLPEIDVDSVIDTIIGIIVGNNSNGGNSSTESDKDTEIPDTGSDSDVLFVFLSLAMSTVSLGFIINRRRKASEK